MEFYQRPDYDVLVAADVGKRAHHLFAVEPATGEVLLDGRVANREADVRSALGAARARGRATLVTDQPGPLSATLFACARSLGCQVRFVTPSAMHSLLRAADPDRKSDEWDARVIALAANGSPWLLKEPRSRHLGLAAECQVYRAARREQTSLMNALHDLMLSESAAFESAVSALGVGSDLALMLLRRWGGPAGLLRCGRANLRRAVLATAGMGPAAAARAEAVYDAAASQPTLGEGALECERAVRELAAALAGARERVRASRARMEGMLAAEPAAALLTSMPGVGVVTAAVFMAEAGDASGFRSADALAHYAGLCPRVARSSDSLDTATKSVSCNRRLRAAMVLAANAARQRPGTASAAYYARRREPDAMGRREGHYHALVALANKMVRTLWAMLRDGTAYDGGRPAD